ncbi:uncharacterized protein LOC135203030 isoform X2 [Macrobrachium nipponense]|uniref:uncharacterized protein LOC135203030 isoform X2 n=1 Tax=Macrobrachium nipponense TaxID=159736 RepID=UPI0030C7DBA7
MALRKPWDEHSAKDVMMKFSDMAYALHMQDTFQAAVKILYGREFVIRIDFSKRMVFFCQACQKEMTAEKAMLEHHNSGNHQKNLSREPVVKHGRRVSSQFDKYCSCMLQYQLLQHSVPALGLMMVEEYRKHSKHKEPYYKCNLCGVHGRTELMLKHLVGDKHTAKYIGTRCKLSTSALTLMERKNIHRQLLDFEGLNCSLIKRIIGYKYFPDKWIAKDKAMSGGRNCKMLTEDVRCRSSSPVPGASTHRSRSSGYSPIRSQSPDQDQDKWNTTIELDPQSPSSERKRKRRSSASPELAKYRNRSPSPVIIASSFWANDKSVQVHTGEEIAVRLNFVVKTMNMPDSALVTKDDVETSINHMFAISHVLHKWELAQKPGPTRDRRISVLEKIMGQIKFRLMPVANNMQYCWEEKTQRR